MIYKGMITIGKNIRILFVALFFTIFLFVPSSAQAQNESTSSAMPKQIDSYNLFWPLVAGKTELDPLYSLKLFKESVGGWFIFGDSKKVDYAILLGTKRVLEAEKLLGEGKNDLAIQALEAAATHYSEAYELAKKAHAKGKFSPQEVRRDRLLNIRLMVDSLKTSAPDDVDKRLDNVKGKANMLLSDYLAKDKDRKFDI